MKVHVGCGIRDFGKDWFNVDGADFSHIHSKDIFLKNLEDNSVDLIYASHLIAYFDYQEIRELFNCWKRVLKEDAILRIATPDFEKLIDLYQLGEVSLDQIIGPLYGKMLMNESYVYHKTTYDFEKLRDVLEKIGFRRVKEYNWRNTDHSQFDDHSQAYIPHMHKKDGVLISLNIECKK